MLQCCLLHPVTFAFCMLHLASCLCCVLRAAGCILVVVHVEFLLQVVFVACRLWHALSCGYSLPVLLVSRVSSVWHVACQPLHVACVACCMLVAAWCAGFGLQFVCLLHFWSLLGAVCCMRQVPVACRLFCMLHVCCRSSFLRVASCRLQCYLLCVLHAACGILRCALRMSHVAGRSSMLQPVFCMVHAAVLSVASCLFRMLHLPAGSMSALHVACCTLHPVCCAW